MNGSVTPVVARARAAELRSLAREKSEAYMRARVGGPCDVVVTERGRGLTGDYLSVTVSDPTIPRRARFHGILAAKDRLTAIPA